MPIFFTLTSLLVLDSPMSLVQYAVSSRKSVVLSEWFFCLQHLYVFNEKEVASDLLTFLDSFYKKYPQYNQQDLYIFGESYGIFV